MRSTSSLARTKPPIALLEGTDRYGDKSDSEVRDSLRYDINRRRRSHLSHNRADMSHLVLKVFRDGFVSAYLPSLMFFAEDGLREAASAKLEHSRNMRIFEASTGSSHGINTSSASESSIYST